MATPAEPSKKSIDRAATLLRDWYAGGARGRGWTVDHAAAAELVWDYRGRFRYPLTKITVTMRGFVKREAADVAVSSRLKRLPTILDKLSRHANMKITRMQDIGGCRALLPGRSEVAGVLKRIQKNWDVVEVYDYVASPKPRTGYRATHVVVRRDGCLCEVQLRTPWEHSWALEIERTGSRLDLPRLKDGEGPEELVRYFELASLVLALDGEGRTADDAIVSEFRDLRTAVVPYFQQPTRRS